MGQVRRAQEEFTAANKKAVDQISTFLDRFMEIAAVKAFSAKGSEELLIIADFTMDPEILDHIVLSIPFIWQPLFSTNTLTGRNST
jgi:hypothetical protein